jgi:hypothetical protein
VSEKGVAAVRPRLGRYELITKIGQGGMAEVQLALQRGPAGFEKLVVVKLVHETLATQKAFVDMLLDEARVAALVKHPNVVDIYDLGQADGRFFIAMEYLEGEPLLALLRAGREGKRLDVMSTGRLIADTAEGLEAAHELRSMAGDPLELVHHDISLGNIVVLYTGQVKLVDFGVAKATQTAAGNKNKVQGKFSYMAPEKLHGIAGDRRSDIWSLGCVLWESLTLKRLFRASSDAEIAKLVLELSISAPSKVNSDVPEDYDRIVMRALERDPARRYATAKELANDIEELLRKRGYGAKNDRIARYMQDAFKTHLDARKKLVQEVVSKGTASVEVVGAAFGDDPRVAQGTPSNTSGRGGRADPTFGARQSITPITGVPALPYGEGFGDTGPVLRVALPAATPADAAASAGYDATTIDQQPFAEVGVTTEVTPPPISDDVEERGAPLQRLLARGRAIATHPKQRWYAAGALGGVVVLVLAIALARGGAPTTAEHATAPDSQALASGAASDGLAVVATAAPGATADRESAGSAGSQADAVAGSDHVESGGDGSGGPGLAAMSHAVVSTAHVKPTPESKVDVQALVNQGVQEFVRGSPQAALATLQKAKAARPGFSPTWRALGNVYEKLGDRAAARSAFQRYLAIAPNASDAAAIRARMAKL